MQFGITWKDSGHYPKIAPNPDYPMGIDAGAGIAEPNCKVPLPYPAKRIGAYVVVCKRCGIRVALTTAGRPDDPRSMTIPCRLPVEAA
jgi:hypothetical protein